MRAALGEAYVVTTAPMTSQIGSGALPVDRLPSYGLCVRKDGLLFFGDPETMTLSQFAFRYMSASPMSITSWPLGFLMSVSRRHSLV